MKNFRPRNVLLACGAILGALLIAAAEKTPSFQPPRVAVVDISVVFDDYEKTQDLQKSVEKDKDELRKRVEELKIRHEELEAELPTLKANSEQSIAKNLEKTKVELEAQALQKTKLKEFNDKRRTFLAEITGQIRDTIKEYAEAHDIDIVVEHQVKMENESARFEWPIIHYAKPELDVTEAITGLLNNKYRRSAE